MRFSGKRNDKKVAILKSFGIVFIPSALKSRLNSMASRILNDEDKINRLIEKNEYLEGLVKQLESDMVNIDLRRDNEQTD